MKFFSGVQQIGIGVTDAEEAFKWYSQQLNFGLRLFDDVAQASLMAKFTGGNAEERRAILSLHPHGGGGLEIWQFLNRSPRKSPPIVPGSTGILGAVIGSCPTHILKHNILWEGSLGLNDLYGNVFLAGSDLENGKCGIRGAAIGVSNKEKSEQFYCDILGFKKVREEEVLWQNQVGTVSYLQLEVKQALFSHLLGNMELRLVHFPSAIHEQLFTGRFWGDCGFIHLCLETPNMGSFKNWCKQHNLEFAVDSEASFGMSDSSGRFGYIQDPDGTLIELVETHKIPLSKKLNWYLDLAKYKEKPLEKWKLKLFNWFN
ncbi:MAG: VOC family protein [Luteibaculum sp.]